jgi:hypothetical protein
MSVQSRFLFKLLKISRYRHVIPTGFWGGGGRVFYRYFIPAGFLIAEFERKNIKIFLIALNFLHPTRRDDMPIQSRFLFKLLKIFRYRHVIPTGFWEGGGRVFYQYFIPAGFLIAEIERKNIFNSLKFLTPHR